MPVVIQPEDFSRWLDCKTREPRAVMDLMQPVQEDFFEAIPVSDKVNKVANMGPDLQEQVPLERQPKPPEKKAPDEAQLSFF
jgi:putative SOS response-associated peptidase YedK